MKDELAQDMHKLAVAVVFQAVKDYLGKGNAYLGHAAKAEATASATRFLFSCNAESTAQWFAWAGIPLAEFRRRWASVDTLKRKILLWDAWRAEKQRARDEGFAYYQAPVAAQEGDGLEAEVMTALEAADAAVYRTLTPISEVRYMSRGVGA